MSAPQAGGGERVTGKGKYGGANQADRWRKCMRQGRRWRLSRGGVTWALVVLAIAICSALIALKAHWRLSG
ncbi:hypothetical protein FJ930_23300 [Mesorhizobium sp. B2-4-15]|nr:hypothetical protein FJ930_23300 [Mesorhizobium sp. B2-4-15]